MLDTHAQDIGKKTWSHKDRGDSALANTSHVLKLSFVSYCLFTRKKKKKKKKQTKQTKS